MPIDDVVRDLYDRLMTINEEAFAAALFNSAYHSLAAALHCVQPLHDEAALRRIEKIADKQLSWIDRNAPNYEHSSVSAGTRGHESVFHLLAIQASTQQKIAHERRNQPGLNGKTRG